MADAETQPKSCNLVAFKCTDADYELFQHWFGQLPKTPDENGNIITQSQAARRAFILGLRAMQQLSVVKVEVEA